MDYPETEAPVPEDNKRDTKDIVDAIWQSGWRAGHRQGYNFGYSTGKSVMSNFWVVMAIFISFGSGVGVSYAIDWVQTCEPIAVSDVKSCTTRYGDGR